MLLPEEWRRVKATTKSGPERYGVTGAERALLYETAIQSGLRSNELRSLTDVNHDGELIDFHSLRHTCGAWFAMTGAHPKIVQQVTRHSTITLTMDTYGHLLPGQEADAVTGMRDVLFALPELPEALRATGTDDAAAEVPNEAQRQAQRAERETRRTDAAACDQRTNPGSAKESPKPLQIADLGDDVRRDASKNESRPGRTRTRDQGIMSQRVSRENLTENAHSRDSAALGAAVEVGNAPIDPDLQSIVDHWSELPEAVKAGIVAMVRATERK